VRLLHWLRFAPLSGLLFLAGCGAVNPTVIGEGFRGIVDRTEDRRASSEKPASEQDTPNVAQEASIESPPSTSAATDATPIYRGKERRIALVIGNASYKSARLNNPLNDARDVSDALRRSGFKVTVVTDASQRDMRSAIRAFGGQIVGADAALFYYAGHGVQIRGANHLVPVGSEFQGEADLEEGSVNADYVLRTMEQAKSKVNIVILDACRDNPFSTRSRSMGRGLASMQATAGTVIAFSTAPGSVASDGPTGRNGLYTKHLLENLRHENSEIAKVFQRTRAAVLKESNGRQVPWESTSLIGDFYF